MVRQLFKVEPDAWQEEVLEQFPHHPQQAMKCCKGPGKTAVLAWLCWNFLLTRGENTKIGATSITGKNLHDNLWSEMARWRSVSPLLMDQFVWKSELIHHKDETLAANWFMSAKSWPQTANETQLGSTLAGLWADHVMFVLDECGDIPIPVLRTAEAVLGTSREQGREAHVLLAGNTTSVEGCLYDACVRNRGMWQQYSVTADPDDPKRTPRIDADYARRQIAQYGRDNPWVMINLLAQFPNQGINQLISIEEVEACIGRHLHRNAYEWAPMIVGADIAAFGDDRTVFFPRRGIAYFSPFILRLQDPLQVSGHLMEKCTQWKADAIHVDNGGGYGGAVIAFLRQQSFTVMPVDSQGKANNPKFFNKRAEMAWDACDNLRMGASLPSDCPELLAELITTTYSYKGDRLLLEPKESVKARLGRSPDLADALYYTHAFPVAATRNTREQLFPFDLDRNVSKSASDYDPLSRA